MTAWLDLKNRFLSDPTSRRLGGIASDLTRLANLAQAKKLNEPVFQDVLTELKLFTEWAAPEADLKTQMTLLAVQKNLAKWAFDKKVNASQINRLATRWSKDVLEISGVFHS